MKIVYEATFSIDLGNAIESVGALMDQLNAALAKTGHQEKLRTTSKLFTISVTVDRELNEKENYKMKTLIESTYVNAFPKFDVRLVSFCRQSGNVQQLAS